MGGWTYARRSTFETRPCAPFSEISILSADRATREVYEFKKKKGEKKERRDPLIRHAILHALNYSSRERCRKREKVERDSRWEWI